MQAGTSVQADKKNSENCNDKAQKKAGCYVLLSEENLRNYCRKHWAGRNDYADVGSGSVINCDIF